MSSSREQALTVRSTLTGCSKKSSIRGSSDVAATLRTDDATIESAVLGIVDRLWERRVVGVTHPEAVNLVEQTLPGDGMHALTALRRHGLLASDSPIRILDGAIADHLFATRLKRQIRDGLARLCELDPERDASVIEALTRGSAAARSSSRRVTDRDGRHGGPIARGLAQRAPDATNVALAASLARAGGDRLLDIDGCAALGILAARDRRAFRMVTNMYLDADRAESLRGAEALAHALEYQPRRVGRIVRFRLGREVLRGSGRGRRSLARRLSDALRPLHRVAHGDAASTSREVLGELARRVDLPALPDVAALLDAVDLVRGQVIPFEGDASIAALLDELASDDAATRFRAAAVVRSVSQVIPERMVDSLCDAIGREEDPRVLGRLLLATYRVLELDHDKLLAAVRASRR